MSFSDRLRPVRLLDSLKPWFMLIAVMSALIVVRHLGQIGWEGGYFLILYGIAVGDIQSRLNPPSEPTEEIRPWLPWNKLDAGAKLEYLLPAVSWIAFGIAITLIMISGSETVFDNWLPIAVGLLLTAIGSWELRRRWLRRWDALNSD